jgi:outer membrane protein assembly factor BamB
MRNGTLGLCLLGLATLTAASDLDPAAHWPLWRGPYNNGIARTAVPVEWSATKNLAWKLEIPGKGNSSPVIWGDRIFLTTAVPTESAEAAPPPPVDAAPQGAAPGGRGGRPRAGGLMVEHRYVLMCVDRKTGKVLWERTANTGKPHEGHHPMYGSFSSNSPLTDGRHVYAFFGSRGLYAYDFDGKLIWKRDSPQLRMFNTFGEGVAPMLDGDRLIVSFDNQENSHLVALDKRTGKELWRVDRQEITSWAQPLVVEHNGKKQVIVSATTKVRSYDLATGKLIWEASGLGANVIPAPVGAGDVVYVMSGYRNPNLMAIRLGKEGDLTGSDAILWTNQRGNSYTASPVLDGDKLYFVSDNGLLTCLNTKSGQPHYIQQRLPKPYSLKASPVAAGGKLYLATEDGDVVVVKMGETYEVLATNKIADEMFISSPAVAEGTLYLRSQKALYAVREGAR